jgi:hypothetical protein
MEMEESSSGTTGSPRDKMKPLASHMTTEQTSRSINGPEKDWFC